MWQRLSKWHPYAKSVALIALVTLLCTPIRTSIEPTNLVMLYLLAVVVIALRWGQGAAILASMLSAAAYELWLVPPYLRFLISDLLHVITLVGLLAVALVISTLAARSREQTKVALRRQRQTAVLYELSRDLAAVVALSDIRRAVAAHVDYTLSSDARFHLSDEVAAQQVADGHEPLTAQELAAAEWVVANGRPAGCGTYLFAMTGCYCLPLPATERTLGALLVRRRGSNLPFDGEQRQMLQAFANQAGQAIERILLAEKASQAQLLREKEMLQTALLNSISHDLRTPLASITGALSTIDENLTLLDEPARRDLIETAREEAERLNDLVSNLLDMSRLESDTLTINRQPCDIQDLIGVALGQLGSRIDRSPLQVEIPQDLPLISVDFVLMVQVLVNLLDNALKYSPADGPIKISVRQDGDELMVSVADRGPGIPPAEVADVFDRFYRGTTAGQVHGSGLGLAISRGIVELHGGRIWAASPPEGGTVVMVAVPVGNGRSTTTVMTTIDKAQGDSDEQ